MARPFKPDRFNWFVEQLAALRPHAAITAEARGLFEIRPRQAQKLLAAARVALARTSDDLNLDEKRAACLAGYEKCYRLAMGQEPPKIREALTALDSIVKLLGLSEPERVELLDGLDPRGSLTSTEAIRKRLAELEGRERVTEAEIVEPKALSEPDDEAPPKIN